MLYNLKHYKPKDQTPSAFLVKNIEKIQIIDKPILDLACGYGRNGGYLARKYRVVFIDNDQDCLNFVRMGKNLSVDGDIDVNNIRVLKRNLRTGKLPFPDNSTGGVIDVHYYNPLLIGEMIRVLAPGGFFCFESIGGRGNNIYELPDYRYIKFMLKSFEIVSYFEKMAKPEELCKSVTKIFAIKRFD